MTLVFSSTKMLIVRSPRVSSTDQPASSTALRAASSMVDSIISLSDRLGSRIGATLVGVGAVETDDDGRVDVDPPHGLEDAVGHFFTSGDAAEDVDEDGLDVGVVVDDLERSGHDVGVGAAADVQEVGGLATHLVDDVDGAHGQPGAVGDHADRALEARRTAGPCRGRPLRVRHGSGSRRTARSRGDGTPSWRRG